MQNDLQLLLLIIGMVVGVFLIYKTFREHHSHRKAPSIIGREFQKKIIEHGHQTLYKKEAVLQMAETDPLLDSSDFTHAALSKDIVGEANINSAVISKVKKPAYEVITFMLIPRNALTFSGLELSVIFAEEKFHFGKMKIFHCHHKNNPEQPVIYSIASMVEPGIFNLLTMPSENFYGIALWMVFQSDTDPEAFEKMLNDAKRLAEKLNATLCDERRKQLTIQTISEIRARIQECSYGEFRQSAG